MLTCINGYNSFLLWVGLVTNPLFALLVTTPTESLIMRLKLTVVTFFLVAVLLLAACNEDSITPPEEPGKLTIENIAFPDTVWSKSEYDIAVTVLIHNVDNPDSIFIEGRFQPQKISSVTRFFLFDDGTHGDNIPGDNLYTQEVSSTIFKGNSGSAKLEIIVFTKPNEMETHAEENFSVIDDFLDTAPVLRNLTAPDSVRYDLSERTLVSIEAADPQGHDDISKVTGLLYSPYAPVPDESITFHDDGSGDDLASGDGVFTGVIVHDAIRLHGAGLYTLLVSAVDKSGNKSSESITFISFHALLTESPPEIISVFAPDSIIADNSLILLEVEVFDANGLSDIDRVIFFSVRPDGTIANNGNPFFLYDDGGMVSHGGVFSGDKSEGDGVYSLTIQIPPTTVKGTFTFRFRAVDKTGLKSPFFEHPVVVY